jgi:hypothetical protein
MYRLVSPGSQAPDARPSQPKRRRRISQLALHGLISGAARQREALPVDHPRRRPSLPSLKFLQKGAAE